jgi:hypothetical protein
MRTAQFLVVAAAATAVTLLAPGVGAAHELRTFVQVRDTDVYVEAGYYYGGSDADPAGAAAVTVTDAGGKSVAAGTTDERGVWTFPRPPAGTYTVVVEQAGHRSVVTIAIPESGTAEFFPWGIDRRAGVVIGVAVVLGLTLAYRLVRRR